MMKTHIDFLGMHVNLAPRSHRRWLVVFFYVAMMSWTLRLCIGTDFLRAVTLGSLLIFAIALLVFVGYAGFGEVGGDEREIHRRDHAYFIAHRKMSLLVFLAAFAVSLRGFGPLEGFLPAASRGLIMEGLARGVMFTLIMTFVTLPQAIILWTEPDLDPDPPAFS
jgi:hypothetical protein